VQRFTGATCCRMLDYTDVESEGQNAAKGLVANKGYPTSVRQACCWLQWHNDNAPDLANKSELIYFWWMLLTVGRSQITEQDLTKRNSHPSGFIFVERTRTFDAVLEFVYGRVASLPNLIEWFIFLLGDILSIHYFQWRSHIHIVYINHTTCDDIFTNAVKDAR